MFFADENINQSLQKYFLVINSGLIGVLLRFITPLTITPAVAMIGISLFGAASNFASSHWGISIG